MGIRIMIETIHIIKDTNHHVRNVLVKSSEKGQLIHGSKS